MADKKSGKKKTKSVYTGKRKKAVARAKISEGKGNITINSFPLDVWGSEMLRLWVKEPVMLAENLPKGVDIEVNVSGGGTASQAEASRIAIARSLVGYYKDKKLKEKYIDYDRNLLVFDSRRTEPHKPSRSRKGARRHKQRSKR